MKLKDFLNVGTIHDIPIGKWAKVSQGEECYVVFRETHGHLYIFVDEHGDGFDSIAQGYIENGKIVLPSGHSIDLHSGQLDQKDHFLRSFIPWIENNFLLFSPNPPSMNRLDQVL